jgi:hypothetical protein
MATIAEQILSEKVGGAVTPGEIVHPDAVV